MMKHLVKSEWVASRLGKLQVIDASWHMPATNRNGFEEFCKERIPGARFFDLDDCCDKTSSLPHMMPSTSEFVQYMNNLGIVADKPIVVYDTIGNFSSPRLWWMLKSMGAKDVAVLDGGLVSWKSMMLPLDSEKPQSRAVEQGFVATPLLHYFTNCDDISATVQKMSKLDFKEIDNKLGFMIDARSAARFNGEVDEPRPGLKRGHIPFSLNVPWDDLIDKEKKTFLSPEEILTIFKNAGFDVAERSSAKVTFTCGSGVTACVPLLALAHFASIPLEHFTVYDGAWSEWGALQDNKLYPVEVTGTIESVESQT